MQGVRVGEARLEKNLFLRVVPQAVGYNGDALIAACREAWALIGGEGKINTALASLPVLKQAIPIMTRTVNARGKPASAAANLQAGVLKFVYKLRRPCQCCHTAPVEIDVPWTTVRDFLLRPGADLSHFVDRADIAQKAATAFFKPPGNEFGCAGHPLKPDWVLSNSWEGAEGCAVCLDCGKLVAAEALKRKAAEEAENARWRSEMQRAQETMRREQESHEEIEYRTNPPYVVVSHRSSDPDGFSVACSERVRNGYKAWGGLQIDPQGNLVQAFQRMGKHEARERSHPPTQGRRQAKREEW